MDSTSACPAVLSLSGPRHCMLDPPCWVYLGNATEGFCVLPLDSGNVAQPIRMSVQQACQLVTGQPTVSTQLKDDPFHFTGI